MIYFNIVLFFALIFVFDFIPIFKEKKKLQTFVYGIVLALSFTVIFLHEQGVNIPGPDIPIKYFIQQVLKLS